jgi:DNA-binding NarL/FixJ family response regulator
MQKELASRLFQLLTPREREIVTLVSMGYGNKAIAYKLGVADSTVRVLTARALRKLGATSRRELCNELSGLQMEQMSE